MTPGSTSSGSGARVTSSPSRSLCGPIHVKRRFLPTRNKPPELRVASRRPQRGRPSRSTSPHRSAPPADRPQVRSPRLDLTAGPELLDRRRGVGAGRRVRAEHDRYEWSAPGATALVVPVRAADPVIGEHRRAHTPSGKKGMPAHVTLLAPFIHASRLDSLDRHRLSDTVGRFPAFDFRLSAFGPSSTSAACGWRRSRGSSSWR